MPYFIYKFYIYFIYAILCGEREYNMNYSLTIQTQSQECFSLPEGLPREYGKEKYCILYLKNIFWYILLV